LQTTARSRSTASTTRRTHVSSPTPSRFAKDSIYKFLSSFFHSVY
jgi:hypothetical protein